MKLPTPSFSRDAWAEQDREAIWAFTAARNAEERHARLYKFALTAMVAGRATAYQVCRNCGWVEDGTRRKSVPTANGPPISLKKCPESLPLADATALQQRSFPLTSCSTFSI